MPQEDVTEGKELEALCDGHTAREINEMIDRVTLRAECYVGLKFTGATPYFARVQFDGRVGNGLPESFPRANVKTP